MRFGNAGSCCDRRRCVFRRVAVRAGLLGWPHQRRAYQLRHQHFLCRAALDLTAAWCVRALCLRLFAHAFFCVGSQA